MKFIKKHVAAKSILGIVALLIVFFALVSVIGYRSFTKALLEQYADSAFRTAETAELALNSSLLPAYELSGGVTREYKKAYNELDAVCNSSGSTFIYVIIPDRSDYGHIKFIFSTMNKNSSYTHYDFGYVRETTNDDYRAKYRALCEGTSERALVVRDKGFIETDPHITAMLPLKNGAGATAGILCVQRQMEELISTRNNYLRNIALVLAGLSALVVLLHGLYLSRVFLQPVKKITEEAARFASEGVPAETKLCESIRNEDEIGLLASCVDDMEYQIHDYVRDITRITAERERISTELALATRLQAAFIPDRFPAFPEHGEFDVFASMDPAKEVGGDFYDFFMIDADHLCLVIADVSGKGVPAALFMMASKIILQSCAMLGRSAAEILTKTNEAICSNNKENMFISVWLGILELKTGRLTAANAGHEYPALMRRGGSFEIFRDRHGIVIGGVDGVKYREYELTLEPGDKLFVYTDGVPEAAAATGEMFGLDRMTAALNAACGGDPQSILRSVRSAVDGFVNGADQFDDITMLCLEYKGVQ